MTPGAAFLNVTAALAASAFASPTHPLGPDQLAPTEELAEAEGAAPPSLEGPSRVARRYRHLLGVLEPHASSMSAAGPPWPRSAGCATANVSQVLSEGLVESPLFLGGAGAGELEDHHRGQATSPLEERTNTTSPGPQRKGAEKPQVEERELDRRLPSLTHYATDILPLGRGDGKRDTVREKYSHSLTVGTALYAIPENAQEVMKIDIRKWQMTFLEPALGKRPEKYGQAVAIGGMVYVVPKRQHKVLKINTDTDAMEEINVTLRQPGRKWDIAIAVGLHIYGVPLDAKRVLKINTTNDDVSLIGTEDLGVAANKWASCAAVGRLIYCAPLEAKRVLKIDTATDIVSHLLVPSKKQDQVTLYRWGSTVACGAVVYGIPFNAKQVLKIDTTNDTVTLIGQGIGNKNGKWGLNSAALWGGNIYAMPFKDGHVLKIDTYKDKVERLKADKKPESGESVWVGAVVVGGRIYSAPYRARHVLRFDPRSKEMNLIGEAVSMKFGDTKVEEDDYAYQSCVSSAEVVWCVPGTADRMLRVDTMASNHAEEAEGCDLWILEVAGGGFVAGVFTAMLGLSQGYKLFHS